MKSLLTYYNIKNNYFRYKLVDTYFWKNKSTNVYNSYGELLVNIIHLEESNPGWLVLHLRKVKNKHYKKLVIRFE